jgi:hypothetical protein
MLGGHDYEASDASDAFGEAETPSGRRDLPDYQRDVRVQGAEYLSSLNGEISLPIATKLPALTEVVTISTGLPIAAASNLKDVLAGRPVPAVSSGAITIWASQPVTAVSDLKGDLAGHRVPAVSKVRTAQHGELLDEDPEENKKNDDQQMTV